MNKEVVNKNNVDEKEIKRFDIWWCDYGDLGGTNEIGGKDYRSRKTRPCIVISNDRNNKFAPMVITIPLTSNINKKPLPVHVHIGEESGLRKPGIAMCEQHLTVSKDQLIRKIGTLHESRKEPLERAIKLSISDIFS